MDHLDRSPGRKRPVPADGRLAGLEALVTEGLVARSYLKDPWARPFHYALTESGYLLSGVDDTGRTVPPVIERVLPADKP